MVAGFMAARMQAKFALKGHIFFKKIFFLADIDGSSHHSGHRLSRFTRV